MGVLYNCWAGRFQSANNEYVACGTHSAFNFAPGVNQFSVHAWFRTTAIANGGYAIIAKGLKANMQYGVKTNGIDALVHIGSETYTFDIDALLSIELNDGEWHQIIVTWDLTSFKIYVDGQLADTRAFTGTTLHPVDLTIGGVRDTDMSNIIDVWEGWLDEVGIWSKYLSGVEVTALYNGGNGLMLDDDSGNYEGASELEGWWRMGDGPTEHAGSVPTATIYDESENGRNGTFNSNSMDLDYFYYGGDADAAPVPGTSYCVLFISSSSITPAIGPSFTVTRADQGNLADRAGFEGAMYRMTLLCEATEGVVSSIFVHEMGRPYPGISLRKQVFRRIASVSDLTLIPEDTPKSIFPFAFRKTTAEIYAPSVALLNKAWREIQRQCATLSLDMQEFGAPTPIEGGLGTGLQGGAGEAEFVAQETFGAPAPYVPSIVLPSSSSSSSLYYRSSSGLLLPGSSSSSWTGDPYAGMARYSLLHFKDAATRFHQPGAVTLFNDLGFLRFGRGLDPDEYWDAFVRFLVSVPKCALIESAYLIFLAHTSEAGDDVVLRVRDIYQANGNSVERFEAADDPALARGRGVIWDLLETTGRGALLSPMLDVTELLQYFIDRWNYSPGEDYFGLWIEEVVSDAGARRDAIATPGASPYLQVQFRTDRGWCGSSSSAIS